MNSYFNQSMYKATILENKTGTLPTLPEKIVAKDGDIGINEKVSYSIQHVDPPGYHSTFSIEADSGVLELKTPIDRENCSFLTVEIKATQQDNDLKTANTIVLVTIQDLNDNPPEFPQSSYMVSVPENSPDGTMVLQVTATDKDEDGFRGTFSLIPDDSPFQISDTGILTVRNSSALDRERTATILLQVKARDHLLPYFEAHSTVTISLLDENDNTPAFEGTPYKQQIFSNMTAGMPILQVVAHDPDDGRNGETWFLLVSGNEEGHFELNETSGQISLKTLIPLLVNQLKNFTLWITATDGGMVPRSSSVPVQVFAVGDSRPRFIHKTYDGTLEEELNSPVPVTRVVFVSVDPHIPVALQVLTESDIFDVDINGTIWTKTKLDYESQKSHEINVSLTDGKTIDYAAVFIKVTDINDNSPVFSAINATINVLESMQVGATVLNVSAADADDGFNGLVSYTLKGGEGKMDIDSVTGLIVLRRELDRETQAFYNLTVIASDQGQPALSAVVNFTIFVDDVNDNPPTFPLSGYEVRVSEDEMIGKVLVTVSATDLDSGANAQVKYRIISQLPLTSMPMVLVNSTTGQLTLSQQLDYETVKLFEVRVEVSDEGIPSLNTSMLVVIQVLDVNDNPPEFSQAVYSIFVLENIQKDSLIYALNVTDKDQVGFSQGYFILNNTMFAVNKHGILSIRNDTELDRDSTPRLTLQVWTVDAETEGLNSSALLDITVLDVNDNNPEFQMQPFSFTTLEGDYTQDAPTVVGHVAATDLDEGENAHITFHLFAEDGVNPFSIQQNGTILANGFMDREIKEKYELLLVASDNGVRQRQNFTYVTISVLDVNDNPPQFTKTQYSANIRIATEKEGVSVLSVSATDRDLANNSLISYSFMNHSDDFWINNLTGEITLTSDLAHITADTVITLTVIATDHGVPQLTSNAPVILYLLVNDTDFGLTFESSSYEFSVLDQEPVTTAVGSVKALTGSIAIRVIYSLKSHTDKFSVNDQGNIMTLVSLDREEQDLYSIIVEAIDSAMPPNSAVTSVQLRPGMWVPNESNIDMVWQYIFTIIVNDTNDNSPVFSTLIQTKRSAPENEDTIDFGIFSAVDQDVGVNALISYSLENHFEGTFHINSSTGRLTSKRALDREMVDSYESKIIATDSGFPKQSASLVLSITVEDVNDNPPVFLQKSFNVTVKENEPPSVILNVTATDKDTGYNAIIHYGLTEATSFYLGELSGHITTLQPLDYENCAQHTIVLKAFNPGDPHFQDTANVTVNVEDVNEEGPRFDRPSYYKILQDSSTAGMMVIDINATDESKGFDEGIYYNLTGGNFEGLFKISSIMGQITLTRDIVKQTTTVQYSLMVTATDSGLPPLSTSVKVSVMIAPINTSFPVFSAVVYQPDALSEKALAGTFVVQISVLYKSPVIYTIISGNEKGYFSIDQFSGIIRTTKNLTVEEFPILFIVQAIDSSEPNIYSQASVQVTVIDENDFPPVFPSSLLEATLQENSTSTQIIQLKAQDNDTGRNGFLTYGILSGDRQKFRIDEATGILYSTVPVDYEEGPTKYQVVIYAEDSGIPEKKRGYYTIIINIIDINDCQPVFDPVNTLSVTENAPVGFIVGKVTATDKDEGDNAFVLYNLIGGGGNIFEIDEVHGNIKVKNSPDYETLNRYILTVNACNNKSAPFYQANTTVTVVVADINDNAPEFTEDSYFAAINMTNPVAAHVITVKATDKDQGENALIEYYILSDVSFSPFFLTEDINEGKIITIGNLSKPGEMPLRIIAKDRGSPPLNSTALIMLNVLDNRPFVPQFNQTDISTTVMEDTGAAHLVYTFAVTEALGRQIDYKIVSGNERAHFILDTKSGQLKTAINLNYEEISQYTITVEANESPSSVTRVQYSGLFSQNVARLTILVQDVNEKPAFLNSSYSVRILNSVPYKFPVVKVQATDPDSGDNGFLLYSLVNHQTNEFDIDENTGQIYTVSVTGKIESFPLQVKAADQGGKGLTTQATVDVTIDPSSNDNIVVLVLSQKINIVERNIPELKRVLEEKLEWTVYIIDVLSKIVDRRVRESTDVTHVKIVAVDQTAQAIPEEHVKRKCKEQEMAIQTELEKIFGTSVSVAVEEIPVDSMPSELIATIILSILLGCTLIAFVTYIFVNRKRNAKLQLSVKEHNEINRNIGNPYATDSDTSPQNVRKQDDNDAQVMEVKDGKNINKNNDEKEILVEKQKCDDRDILLLDGKNEHEENVALKETTEPNNVAPQLTTEAVTKQTCFLTETNDGPAFSLTPDPRMRNNGKGLKGVRFSEVAIILEPETEQNDPDLDILAALTEREDEGPHISTL
ncbi:protocadherin Fat 4-like [Chelonia mydas]|uniref:protocadherin Fat 4-like n=1 Tax=Chelonia mydas TaxID=8469 RepID=UPI001CA9EA30|nr:protocadherin Fat 4-like [Chelonia mydas]